MGVGRCRKYSGNITPELVNDLNDFLDRSSEIYQVFGFNPFNLGFFKRNLPKYLGREVKIRKHYVPFPTVTVSRKE
jgi:hypothetical protein